MANIAFYIGIFTLFGVFFIDGRFWYLSILGFVLAITDMIKQIKLKDGYKNFFAIVAAIINLITIVTVAIMYILVVIHARG